MRKRRALPWIVAGFALTLPAFVLLFLTSVGYDIDHEGHVGAVAVIVNLLWYPVFLASFFFLRWRALWLLTSAPLALYVSDAVHVLDALTG